MNAQPAQFITIRYPDGRIAFRYDPVRRVVELQDRRCKHYFDLTQIIANLTVDKTEQLCYDVRQ